MKKYYYLFVAAALLLAALPVSAQRKSYAYGSSIDLQLGYAASPVTVKGEAGKAVSLSDGVDFNFRYTYFFGRRFGAFGQIGIADLNANAVRYFGALHKADGYKYCYAADSGAYNDFELAPVFAFGPAFRTDMGGWSFRARIGIGGASFFQYYDSYKRYSKTDSSVKPMYFERQMKGKTYDYLVDADIADGNKCRFMVTPSFQVKFSPAHHFYFSAEVGAYVMPSSLSFIVTEYSALPTYNPQNWAEAIYQSDDINHYQKDYTSGRNVTQTIAAPAVLYATFGIGWEIGWNRNYRHRHINFYSL